MAIYALFSNISARSGLGIPFTTAWSKIDSISWGTDRPFSYKAGTTSSTSSIINCENIRLNKAVDGASIQIIRNVLTGAPLSFANIAITDAGKTIIAFKLMNVIVTSNELSAADSANEVISLTYRQIAVGILTATTIDTISWDIVAATTWSVPATTFALDATYGIKFG